MEFLRPVRPLAKLSSGEPLSRSESDPSWSHSHRVLACPEDSSQHHVGVSTHSKIPNFFDALPRGEHGARQMCQKHVVGINKQRSSSRYSSFTASEPFFAVDHILGRQDISNNSIALFVVRHSTTDLERMESASIASQAHRTVMWGQYSECWICLHD